MKIIKYATISAAAAEVGLPRTTLATAVSRGIVPHVQTEGAPSVCLVRISDAQEYADSEPTRGRPPKFSADSTD